MERDRSHREIKKMYERSKIPRLIAQHSIKGTLISQRLLNRKMNMTKTMKSTMSSIPTLQLKSHKALGDTFKSDTLRENKEFEIKNFINRQSSKPNIPIINQHRKTVSSGFIQNKSYLDSGKDTKTNLFYHNMRNLERRLALFYQNYLQWDQS